VKPYNLTTISAQANSGIHVETLFSVTMLTLLSLLNYSMAWFGSICVWLLLNADIRANWLICELPHIAAMKMVKIHNWVRIRATIHNN